MEKSSQSIQLLYQVPEAYEGGEATDINYVGFAPCLLGYANATGFDKETVAGVDR